MPSNNWIAVDWGTSNLRLWHLDALGNVLDHVQSSLGMSKLLRHEFQTVFMDLASKWLKQHKTLVLGCGMMGAKEGWAEVTYQSVPVKATPSISLIKNTDSKIDLYICHGLKQAISADVMRGEETQIAGFVSNNPAFNGWLCIPGTHSKWIRLSEGKILAFRTFMTGELYAVLGRFSLLSKTIEHKSKASNSSFVSGFNKAFNSPEDFSYNLFELRAKFLFLKNSKKSLDSEFSGLCLGLEFSGVKNFINNFQKASFNTKDSLVEGFLPISLLANDKLKLAYTKALSLVDWDYATFDVENLTLNGLKMVKKNLEQ